MLNGMIDMLLRWNLRVIPMVEVLTILFGAILRYRRSGEHRVERQQVKAVWRVRLLSARFVFNDWGIRLDTLYDLLFHLKPPFL